MTWWHVYLFGMGLTFGIGVAQGGFRTNRSKSSKAYSLAMVLLWPLTWVALAVVWWSS